MAKQSPKESNTFQGKSPSDAEGDSTKFNFGESDDAQRRLAGESVEPLVTVPLKG